MVEEALEVFGRKVVWLSGIKNGYGQDGSTEVAAGPVAHTQTEGREKAGHGRIDVNLTAISAAK